MGHRLRGARHQAWWSCSCLPLSMWVVGMPEGVMLRNTQHNIPAACLHNCCSAFACAMLLSVCLGGGVWCCTMSACANPLCSLGRRHSCLNFICCWLQGLVEMQKMQQTQHREAAAVASRSTGIESEEDDDAKVDKQRAMDDWKNDNPKGWGNSKLRPTA